MCKIRAGNQHPGQVQNWQKSFQERVGACNSLLPQNETVFIEKGW